MSNSSLAFEYGLTGFVFLPFELQIFKILENLTRKSYGDSPREFYEIIKSTILSNLTLGSSPAGWASSRCLSQLGTAANIFPRQRHYDSSFVYKIPTTYRVKFKKVRAGTGRKMTFSKINRNTGRTQF